jgi:hypothetical protein
MGQREKCADKIGKRPQKNKKWYRPAHMDYAGSDSQYRAQAGWEQEEDIEQCSPGDLRPMAAS